MAASLESYLDIVGRAHEGKLKLPAFQRDWKWKASQVILLFDSLRQGFPIGSFLFIKENKDIDLAPRAFRGASNSATEKVPETLVLDGQQRITAGLELFYGHSFTQYFLDLNKIYSLYLDRQVDLTDTSSIRRFLLDLEAEDQYFRARKASTDPESNLLRNHLLWTKILLDDIELERALSKYKTQFPDRSDFTSYLIGKNFRPSTNSTIPITSIDGDITIEAVSRIFSTLNSTGKMLTPFELVVAILFPHGVNLADDVTVAKEAYPYYARIDATGDILLQTIALFAGRDTKKASLPKTIDVNTYHFHFHDAVKYLDNAAKLLTEKIGLGLDQSSELLVYPVIFSPMAYVLKVLEAKSLGTHERAAAEQKIAKWFIGAVLDRRYQQSTHDKQARDKDEIVRWVEGGDEAMPSWLTEVYVPNLKISDPDGALGKLLRSLSNARGLKDPYTSKAVGVGSGKQTTAKHHIFPTRFVTSLRDWNPKNDTANLALNVMFCEQSTNASWLNLDPAVQFQRAMDVDKSEDRVRGIYAEHGIPSDALAIMRKPNKKRVDFYEFVEARERFFVSMLETWGFQKPIRQPIEDTLEVIED